MASRQLRGDKPGVEVVTDTQQVLEDGEEVRAGHRVPDRVVDQLETLLRVAGNQLRINSHSTLLLQSYHYWNMSSV